MKKILIIEDDYTQNNVLANFLRNESYEVFSAYTIKEAQTYMLEPLHLVILDVMLPDGNGLDFLKELRQKSQVPVIVLTALDDEFTQLQTFDLKADEYVDKPVSPFVMTKRVKALLSRFYDKNENSHVNIGDFCFDFDSFQVTKKDGKEIALTSTEMKIIQMLYEHRGTVVSRDAIMDSVWGAAYVGDDRLIDTHIKNIRKKLNPDIIVTVKGIGYKMLREEV